MKWIRCVPDLLVIGIIALLFFSLLGEGRYNMIVSRLRGRHSLGRDIRPCCEATKEMKLKTFVEQSNNCQSRATLDGGLNCGCEEVMACKMVVVTAISDNHFVEAMDFLASVQTHMPTIPILVYNLGLTQANKDKLNSYCEVKVREFPFKKYPPHVTDLLKFSWKPLIINEVASEYEVVMWCDASCRLRHPLFSLLPRLSSHPLIPGPTTVQPFITTVHDEMLKYLKLTQSRKVLASLGRSLQANAIIMWINEDLQNRFLKYWVDCALHLECISPKGAKISPCILWRQSQGVYSGCHRYDQAAYNAILTREYGMDFMREIKNRDIRSYLFIVRQRTNLYSIVTKCPLG